VVAQSKVGNRVDLAEGLGVVDTPRLHHLDLATSMPHLDLEDLEVDTGQDSVAEEVDSEVVLVIEVVVMAAEEVLAIKEEEEVLVAEVGMEAHQMDIKVVLPQMHRLVLEEIEGLVGMEVVLAALRMVAMVLDQALVLVQMAVGMAVTYEEAAPMMTDPLTAATEVMTTEAVVAIASR
jgi:hypothetical protein